MPLTDYERQRIIAIHLNDIKKTPTQIQKIMGSEGTVTTCQTVQATIKRWKETGSYKDRYKSGRPKLIPDDHYKFINEVLEKNNELTTSDLMEALRKRFGEKATTYSERTIARARVNLGWTFFSASYTYRRKGHKARRMELVSDGEGGIDEEPFDDVICTDRSPIRVESSRKRKCRRRGQPT